MPGIGSLTPWLAGLNHVVPWGQRCAPLLTQGLTSASMQGTLWVHAALSALFLWRNWRGSSTRQPEVARDLHNFQLIAFIFPVGTQITHSASHTQLTNGGGKIQLVKILYFKQDSYFQNVEYCKQDNITFATEQLLWLNNNAKRMT